jgi:hypothetical protein
MHETLTDQPACQKPAHLLHDKVTCHKRVLAVPVAAVAGWVSETFADRSGNNSAASSTDEVRCIMLKMNLHGDHMLNYRMSLKVTVNMPQTTHNSRKLATWLTCSFQSLLSLAQASPLA